jgi:hypothetical protein
MSCVIFIYIQFIFYYEHCKLSHGEETLKYRQLVLDENTGIQRYQTKIHDGVVPSNLTKYENALPIMMA